MDYTDRHDQGSALFIGTFAISLRFQWKTDRLVEMNDITMMWDTAIPTTKKIGGNCVDICLRNNKTDVCLLTDISCSADGNIARKEADKSTEYICQCLAGTEVLSRMWLWRKLVVPVLLEA